MKVIYSPLVASMSGTAAQAVASNWKGRNYIRKYAIPKNPRTVDQVLYRGRFARMPLWYRSLPVELTAEHIVAEVLVPACWQNIADADQLSVANELARACLTALKDDLPPPLMRGNPKYATVGSLTAVEEPEPSTINLEWTQGQLPAGAYVVIMTIPVNPVEEGLEEEDRITVATPVAVTTLTVEVEVAHEGKDYWVIAVAINAATTPLATLAGGGVAILATSGVT